MRLALHEKLFVGDWVVQIPTCAEWVGRVVTLHGFGVAVVGYQISGSHVSGGVGSVIKEKIHHSSEWLVDVQDSWLGRHFEGQECRELLEH